MVKKSWEKFFAVNIMRIYNFGFYYKRIRKKYTMKKSQIFLFLFFLFIWPTLFFCSGVSDVNSGNISIGEVIVYPNPYDPDAMNIPLKIKKRKNIPPHDDFEGEVRIIIYNANLVQIFEQQFPGDRVEWIGVDSDGERVAAGTYFIKVIQIKDNTSFGSKFTKILIK